MTKIYENYSFYIALAKKIISKFGPKFYSGLSYEMLSSDDAVADVASAIMQADWKFDKERKGQTGQQKTLYSYRNQCGLWAIKTYVTKKYKKHNKTVELNEDKLSILPNTKNSIEEFIENENKQVKNKYLEDILNSDIISNKQKEQIKMYYLEEKTLSEIGNRFGVTREAIRQNILKGINTIKEYVS
jgi:RNA polymerase sigma factor (sigma-70 family)